MIIGISGKIGSGKDTVGKIIQYLIAKDNYLKKGGDTNKVISFEEAKFEHGLSKSWEIKKFAGKLKEVVALLTGCTVENLEDQEFKNSPLSKDWNYYLKLNGHDGLKVNFLKSSPSKEVIEELGKNRIKNYTYREMLQKIGTEAMRDTIHENVWVNALFADYKGIEYYIDPEITKQGFPKFISPKEVKFPNWIITDMRFPNELQAVRDHKGITIRINRLNYKPRQIGASEFVATERLKQALNEHPSETALDQSEFDFSIDNNGTIEELIEKVREILIKEKILVNE